ncbi:MAG: amidohydrolase family protein [Planctomycetes bacterium]|nr:amidohydrolase family protein [Planctomycetota bacterium]
MPDSDFGQAATAEPVDVMLLARWVMDGWTTGMAPDAASGGWVGVLVHTDGLEPGPIPGAWTAKAPVIAAVGTPEELGPFLRGCRVVREEYPDQILIPGLVNGHAHLDLTHIGPQPPSPGGFAAFAGLVREKRAVEPEAIRASVRRGVEMSLAGGVVAVGDIAGAVRGVADVVAAEELARSPLWGTAFLEFFAIGTGEERGRAGLLKALREIQATGIRVGIQPHAPYSVSAESYAWAMEQAAEFDYPMCSHVAESPEERELIEKGTGPLREMLEGLGIWTEGQRGMQHFGKGNSPLAHVMDATDDAHTPFTLVHCNDLSDADVHALRHRWEHRPIRLVYCPRSSEYFGTPHHFGPHRYRELQREGVMVALGTDSIINLEVGRTTITPWHEASSLLNRDAMEAQELLMMMTTHAAMAIGLDSGAFDIVPGRMPFGLAAVQVPGGTGDPLRRAMLGSTPRTILIRDKQ